MTIFGLILALVIIGLLLYLVNTYIPMDEKIRMILNGVVVVIVVLWILNVFGLLPGALSAPVPRLR